MQVCVHSDYCLNIYTRTYYNVYVCTYKCDVRPNPVLCSAVPLRSESVQQWVRLCVCACAMRQSSLCVYVWECLYRNSKGVMWYLHNMRDVSTLADLWLTTDACRELLNKDKPADIPL